MKTCSGTDRANNAADPDWLKQADEQMGGLFSTLEEIACPSCFEAWDKLEDALSTLRQQADMDRDEP